jgi:hypothetical protein
VEQAEARSVIEVMERAFGTSFDGVRLRNDGLSAARAASLGALAYTDGSEVGFGAGSFTPRSREGLRTIAHEFAHVAQSRGGVRGIPGHPAGTIRARRPDSTDSDAVEAQAEEAATNIVEGRRPDLDDLAAQIQSLLRSDPDDSSGEAHRRIASLPPADQIRILNALRSAQAAGLAPAQGAGPAPAQGAGSALISPGTAESATRLSASPLPGGPSTPWTPTAEAVATPDRVMPSTALPTAAPAASAVARPGRTMPSGPLPAAAQATSAEPAADQPPKTPGEPSSMDSPGRDGTPHRGDHGPLGHREPASIGQEPAQRDRHTAPAHDGGAPPSAQHAPPGEVTHAVDAQPSVGPIVDALAAAGVPARYQPELPPPRAIPRAAFRETDVRSLLPSRADGGQAGTRERIVSLLAEEMTAERLTANATIDAFVGERRERAGELSSLKPGLAAAIQDSATAAGASIDSAAAAEIIEVRRAVADVRKQTRMQAQRLRRQIETEYLSSKAAIQAATDATHAALQLALAGSQVETTVSQMAQLNHLGTLYEQAAGQFRGAAKAAADLAMSNAAGRAASYCAGKINRSDGILDGHLTDNRCEAQAEAAQKVGEAYRDELIKEGEKQVATLQGRRPTDEAVVRDISSEAQRSLRGIFDQALRGLDDSHKQSMDNVRAARSQLLRHVDHTLGTVELNLTKHERRQVAQIRTDSAVQKRAVQQTADHNVATLNEAISKAATDVDAGLAALITQLNTSEVPDPAVLRRELESSGKQLDSHLATLGHAAHGQAMRARDSISQAGKRATTAIEQTATAANAATLLTGQGASDAFKHIGSEAAKGFHNLTTGHEKSTRGAQTTTIAAMHQVVTGLSGTYQQLNAKFTQGAQSNADAVRKGLTDAVNKDMPGTITQEAQKAYDQVQPRWKSVLKWVIIIAIVLVVAIVIGPMVVGAIAGAAGALGASGAVATGIGMVLGGALVGAATSAVTTVVDNALSGRDLTAGLGRAIKYGAIGGALGGFAGSFLGPSIQAISSGALRLGAQVAVDMVVGTTLSAFSGDLSWENFGVSMLMSVFTNGVALHPRVQMWQHGFQTRGIGAGFEAGSAARDFFARTAGPGPAGPTGIDATHISAAGQPAEAPAPRPGAAAPGAAPTQGAPAAAAAGEPARGAPVSAEPSAAPAAPEATAAAVEPVRGAPSPEESAGAGTPAAESARGAPARGERPGGRENRPGRLLCQKPQQAAVPRRQASGNLPRRLAPNQARPSSSSCPRTVSADSPTTRPPIRLPTANSTRASSGTPRSGKPRCSATPRPASTSSCRARRAGYG